MMNGRLPLPQILLLLALGLAARPAAAQEVPWRHDYQAARREARELGRPLVIDFSTRACFWCRKLEATTFREPGVVALINQQFIPLKVDADQEVLLTQALGIEVFPTVVLAAPDGKILATLPGYMDAPRFRQHLQQVLARLSPPSGAAARVADSQRTRQAQALLTLARADFQHRHYLCCLERCEFLAAEYPDLPESADARQLAQEIEGNTEWLRQACENLDQRLGNLYLKLADSLVRQGQSRQAAVYLERVIQAYPNTPQAEAARTRLAQIQGPSPRDGGE